MKLENLKFVELNAQEMEGIQGGSLIQDAIVELRSAVDQGIELAERVSAAAFRFARKSLPTDIIP